jgi:hypothetical protein
MALSFRRWFSTRSLLAAGVGAALLGGGPVQTASAAPIPVVNASALAGDGVLQDVAYRARHHAAARHHYRVRHYARGYHGHRRYAHRHYYNDRAGARAALGAFGLVAGAIAAGAARDRYYDDYSYGGYPAYGYGYPAYGYGYPAYGYGGYGYRRHVYYGAPRWHGGGARWGYAGRPHWGGARYAGAGWGGRRWGGGGHWGGGRHWR